MRRRSIPRGSALRTVPARRMPLRVRIGLPCGALAYVLFHLAQRVPATVETVYSTSVYPKLAFALASVSEYLPFSLTDLSFALAALFVFVLPFRAMAREIGAGRGPLRGVARGFVSMLGEAGWIWTLFLLLWGFNYARPDAGTLFRLGPPPTVAHAQEIATVVALECDALRSTITEDARGLATLPLDREMLDLEIRELQRTVLERFDLPSVDAGRTKELVASRLALRWGSAGLYGPLTGEPNVVAGLPAFELPFVVAHERAHLAGFADEAGASFVALLTLWESPRPELRYSAWLVLRRKLGLPAREMSRGVRRDLRALAEFYDAHRGDEAPAVMKIYGRFLESHGVVGGMKSYGRVAGLALRHLARQPVELGASPVAVRGNSGAALRRPPRLDSSSSSRHVAARRLVGLTGARAIFRAARRERPHRG